MTNQIQSSNDKKKYDLEERTAKFGKEIIEFAQAFQEIQLIFLFISQLVRAGTSIGELYGNR